MDELARTTKKNVARCDMFGLSQKHYEPLIFERILRRDSNFVSGMSA